MIERNLDALVIGAGAAGLAAAITAKENGVDSIMILERGEELGGILPQCIHTGFGLHYLKQNLTGPEYIDRFTKKVRELGIEHRLRTMVLDLTPDRVATAISQQGVMKLETRTVILAMGCRERSRGALGIPGTRPAGILTAGTAQRLMDIDGYLPGKQVLILGSGDIGLIMARRFIMEGAEVKGVVEIMPYPGGLDRNLQSLKDFGIPLYLRHVATRINGSERVEAVTISELGGDGKPTGREETIPCDTLILSAGLIPENELSKRAGIRIDRRTGGPVVDENMETSVEGIFACGNVVHVHDLVDHVTKDGEDAGRNAARRVLGGLPSLRKRIRLRAGSNVRYVVPQIVSGERPVTLYTRIMEPAYDVMVSIGDEVNVNRRAVKPPEIVAVDIHEGELEKIAGKKQLTVKMTKRQRDSG